MKEGRKEHLKVFVQTPCVLRAPQFCFEKFRYNVYWLRAKALFFGIVAQLQVARAIRLGDQDLIMDQGKDEWVPFSGPGHRLGGDISPIPCQPETQDSQDSGAAELGSLSLPGESQDIPGDSQDVSIVTVFVGLLRSF